MVEDNMAEHSKEILAICHQIALIEQFVQTEAARWERFDKLLKKDFENIKSRLEAHEKRLEVLETPSRIRKEHGGM